MSEVQVQKNVQGQLQIISEVLHKAVVIAEDIGGSCSSNREEVQEPSCDLARIEIALNIIEGETQYLLERLVEIQRKLGE